jgi:hypothetical protein
LDAAHRPVLTKIMTKYQRHQLETPLTAPLRMLAATGDRDKIRSVID